MFRAINGLGGVAGEPTNSTTTIPGGAARLSHQQI
jgi:hypothetical protein